MARAFTLPDLGEGIHEGEILNVLVSVGDDVEEGDPILEVETEKATAEIPSPFTGKVEDIKVRAGDTVKVGQPLIVFGDGGEVQAEEEARPPQAEEEKKPEDEKVAEPSKGEEEGKTPRAEEPERREKERPPQEAVLERKKGPVPAAPSTRRLARELGIDLREIPPSGPGGRVTSEDVHAFAEEGKKEKAAVRRERSEAPGARPLEEKPPTLPDFTRWGEVERIPLRSIRRATAKQMALAWSQIPHVHNQDMVDMTRMEEFRQKHKEEIEAKGGRLTVTVFALKAVATALRRFPRFNASIDTKTGEMVIKHYYHIGLAVATDEGLVVPVIREVDRKSIVDLSIELNDLVERTRTRKTSLEEMQGGTFTITNVGPMGGGYFAPIINFPEVAILGMGAARVHPVALEQEGARYEIVPRLMMPIVLCIDHRILDGADALLFMNVLREGLEDPETLFMTMT